MAGVITYNTTMTNIDYIYRATSGGTVFSVNEAANVAFDYFTDTAVVNDAIYFSRTLTYGWSDLTLNIGTPISAVEMTLAWEYWCANTNTWRTIHNLTDGTSGFTATGARRVVFPLQAQHNGTTVNGIYVSWIRCRITALTSITEGGANSISRAQRSTGYLAITGYTDAVPCTWLEVYNWIVANAPQCGATRIGSNVYKFDNVAFSINSTLRSNGEKIFIGNGYNGVSFNCGYLWSGTKVGTDGWTTPTDYFFCITAPSGQCASTTTTRVYGGRWDFFYNIVDGLTITTSCLLGIPSGEWIGVYQANSGYFSNAICNKCTVNGGLITSGAVAVYPNNLTIANPGSNIWNVYGNSVDLPNISYSMPSVSMISFSAQYTVMGQTINIINPNPSLPAQQGSVKVFSRSMGSLANMANVLFYDTSAGIFTNYTTQAGDATINDVPLSGDVGDIIYFNTGSVNQSQPALTFTITNQTNDYVYAWEYYRAGSWFTIQSDCIFDLTNNFSQSGIIYFGTDNNFTNNNPTVNSIQAAWIRCRIVTVGTGTPTFSKVQRRLQTGIGNYHINERYLYNLTITNPTGAAIQGATVLIKDKDNNMIGNFATDVNGAIPQQSLIKKYSYFDKTASEANYNGSDYSLNPYTITITKPGYETYVEKINISSVSSKSITIKPSKSYGYII